MTPYQQKLLDPRWQKKRLRILERDEWKCQECGDTETTLHVHHRFYLNNHEPWDYPDEALQTLCADCHTYESDLTPTADRSLLLSVKRFGISAHYINCLANHFHRAADCIADDSAGSLRVHFTIEAIAEILVNPVERARLCDLWFERRKAELACKKAAGGEG